MGNLVTLKIHACTYMKAIYIHQVMHLQNISYKNSATLLAVLSLSGEASGHLLK